MRPELRPRRTSRSAAGDRRSEAADASPSPLQGEAKRGARQHEHQRQGLSHDLARARRRGGRDHRPDQAAARARHRHAQDAGGCGAGDQDHAGARRAADRRHGRLWRLPGAARGRLRRGRSIAPSPFSPSSGRPPSTCAGRSTRCAPRCATCRARPASPPPTQRAAEIARTTSRPTAPSAGTGAKLIEAAAERKKPGERVNILTHCNAGWLACVDRGHGAGADLRGARPRHRAARVGRRDAAAQSGRGADGLRARRPRRAAHHHRRQRRRAPDAAGPGRSVHRRRRPRHQPTATPPTRSAPI